MASLIYFVILWVMAIFVTRSVVNEKVDMKWLGHWKKGILHFAWFLIIIGSPFVSIYLTQHIHQGRLGAILGRAPMIWPLLGVAFTFFISRILMWLTAELLRVTPPAPKTKGDTVKVNPNW